MPFPVAKPQVAPCVRPLAAGVQLETVKKIAQAIFRLSTLHLWPPSLSLGVAPVANGKRIIFQHITYLKSQTISIYVIARFSTENRGNPEKKV